MTDPSFPADVDTPGGFDAEAVIERWKEIEERGHAIPDGGHSGL